MTATEFQKGAEMRSAADVIGTEPRTVAPVTALERHYTVVQVAEMWSWGETKVLEVFRHEPGVLQSQLRTLRPRRRQCVKLSIPESVLLRVHARMSVRDPE